MKNNHIISGFLLVMTSFVFIQCQKDDKPNSAPVIQSVVVNPNSINANGMVSVQVVATDADNDALQYAYTVTGGAISGTGPSVTWTAPSTEGAHSVVVTVSDGKGGVITGNAALTVLKPVTQVTGTASFIAGVSGNLENAKVSLFTSLENFLLNQPVKFAAVTGSGGAVSFTIPNILPGNYYLTVWKDNNNSTQIDNGDYIGIYGQINLGAFNFTELQITEGQTFHCKIDMQILKINKDPVINSFIVNPGQVGPGQRANVSVQAVDEDNDPLSYIYTVDGGIIIGTGNNVQWEAPLLPGNYTIKVKVEDGQGGFDEAQASLRVESLPTRITGTAKFAAGTTGNLENAKVSIYKSIDDWINDIPAKFTAVTGAGNSVTYTLNNVIPGTYYLDVWKDNDNNGVWSTGDFIGVHANNAGMIPIVITEGQTIVVNVEVTRL